MVGFVRLFHRNYSDRSFGILGILLALTVMVAIGCGSSEAEWTCNDEGWSEVCSDPASLPGFLTEICGPGVMKFTESHIKNTIIGEPYNPQNVSIEIGIYCGNGGFMWEFTEGGPNQAYFDFDQWRDASKTRDSESVIGIFEQRSFGLISPAEARRDVWELLQ